MSGLSLDDRAFALGHVAEQIGGIHYAGANLEKFCVCLLADFLPSVAALTKIVAPFKEWVITLGNFHILSFEENRSRGKDPANLTFKDREVETMLLEKGELDVYSPSESEVRHDSNAVLRFVHAARRRMLAIYGDWYMSLAIGSLTGNTEEKAQ